MSDSLQTWLARLERRHAKSIDLGLDRCSEVWQAMGSPRPAPLVFTVAGTNGKGSVVAYISTILRAMGYRCGTYTSPHLLEFNERVRINGIAVSDDQLVAAFEQVERCRGEVSLTYFEFTTLAAFQMMADAGLEAAVLEVGLGGRLDTVNLVDADCAVITPIGLDHQEYLGNDRESIGYEKAGIMRRVIPVICADRDPPQSIRDRAATLSARLQVLGEEYEISRINGALTLMAGDIVVPVREPTMAGRHQQDNLATALVAANELIPGFFEAHDQWSPAVASLQLPGRLSAIASDERFIVDVGHNPMAAGAVAAGLVSMNAKKGQIYCVLGMLKDKDAEGVIAALENIVGHFVCAGLEGLRGQTGAELARRVSASSPSASVQPVDTVNQAMEVCSARAGEGDLILVFGSFETAAAAMRWLIMEESKNRRSSEPLS